MPKINVHATEAAARRLGRSATDLRADAEGISVGEAAAELNASVTLHVLHDLDSLVSLRLVDLGGRA